MKGDGGKSDGGKSDAVALGQQVVDDDDVDHHLSRRKWESPCPPGESTDRACAPHEGLGGSLPLLAEQSVGSTANIWRSPFSQPFAATANAPMESHVARAEALAIPRPRGSGSHSTAPAAESSWP